MSEAGELQFDRADFPEETTSRACARCQKPLVRVYYEANGQTVCPSCCTQLRASQEGPIAGAVVRATVWGLGAAVLGSLLYYGVGALTGYEFGLIAIVVGYGVGYAVNQGSRRRGGWPFQTIAMLLTYLAIVATTIPAIVEVITQPETMEGTTSDEASAGEATGADEEAEAEDEAESEEAEAAVAVDATATPPAEPEQSLGGFLLAIGALVLLACAAPFLAGLENIIGLFIIAIGLYEAWKLNRRADVTITGPHRLLPVQTPFSQAS